MFEFEFQKINQSSYKIKSDKITNDLFLLSQCKHFIVTTSTFNWWGAWLSQSKNKIITRPDENFFTSFKVNNIDYWPTSWIKIQK